MSKSLRIIGIPYFFEHKTKKPILFLRNMIHDAGYRMHDLKNCRFIVESFSIP
jgi:hypothetical protein